MFSDQNPVSNFPEPLALQLQVAAALSRFMCSNLAAKMIGETQRPWHTSLLNQQVGFDRFDPSNNRGFWDGL